MKFIRQEQGFTMIEALLSLLCAALFCMALSQTALVIVKGTRLDYQAEDILAIKQMQLLLAQSKCFTIHNNELHFSYHQEDFYLTQYKNFLVKRKGFEVILQEVEKVSFQKVKNCYEMNYQRDNQNKRVVLVCE